jgi:hypothetical protein
MVVAGSFEVDSVRWVAARDTVPVDEGSIWSNILRYSGGGSPYH